TPPAEVVRLEIENAGSKLTLSKSGTGWTIEQPIRAAADSDEIKRIVDGILDRSTDFILQDPKSAELAKYKLEKPALTATFQDKSGKKRVIRFGDKDPEKSSVYAQDADSKQVFLVGSSDVDSLKKDAGALRDKTVLSVPSDSVMTVKLQR